MRKRKECRFIKYSRRLFFVSFALFVLGMPYFTSCEATYNISIKQNEREIEELLASIDGLSMKKNELTNFARLESVTAKQGYQYFTTSNVAVMSKQDVSN